MISTSVIRWKSLLEPQNIQTFLVGHCLFLLRNYTRFSSLCQLNKHINKIYIGSFRIGEFDVSRVIRSELSCRPVATAVRRLLQGFSVDGFSAYCPPTVRLDRAVRVAGRRYCTVGFCIQVTIRINFLCRGKWGGIRGLGGGR